MLEHKKRNDRYYNEENLVGVIYLPAYWLWWSSSVRQRDTQEKLLFSPILVEAVLNKNITKKLVEEVLECKWWTGDFPSCANEQETLDRLVVDFISPTTLFYVNNYDGYETIKILDSRENTFIS